MTSPEMSADAREQVFAIQNTKNAAHYDLKTVNIIMPDHRTLWVADAAQTSIHISSFRK